MTKAFDKIMAGLEDARAYLNGGRAGFVAHEIKVSNPDVVAIRSKTGLSQPAFARSIGIPLERSRTGSRAGGVRRGPLACCWR